MICDCSLAVTLTCKNLVKYITNDFLKGIKVKIMPVVQVSVWEGMTLENKKVVEGITKVFEDLGIPREATTIVIYEEPKTNWASGGQLHSERPMNR